MGLVSAVALSATGMVAFSAIATAPAGAASTATITVTPNTGLQATGTTNVTVTGSGFADSSIGALLQCNNDPGQPTITLEGNATPVSCGPAPLGSSGVLVPDHRDRHDVESRSR